MDVKVGADVLAVVAAIAIWDLRAYRCPAVRDEKSPAKSTECLKISQALVGVKG